MSTRSNITLDVPTRIQPDILYRHHDGYPAVGGAALLEPIHRAESRLQNMKKNAAKFDYSDSRIWNEVRGVFLNSLFSQGRSVCEADYRDSDTRQAYEFTGALHGDIEYHYGIESNDAQDGFYIWIATKPRFDGDDFPDLDDWAHDGELYTPAGLQQLVNEDRADMNQRIKVRRGEDANFMPAVARDGTVLDREATRVNPTPTAG